MLFLLKPRNGLSMAIDEFSPFIQPGGLSIEVGHVTVSTSRFNELLQELQAPALVSVAGVE